MRNHALRLATLCAVLVAVTVAAHSGKTADPQLAEAQVQFSAFKHEYGRVYASVEEEAMRFRYFRESLARVARRNAEHRTDVFGINQFSDLSRDEWRATYATYKPDPMTESKWRRGDLAPVIELPSDAPRVEDLPARVDWRDEDVVTQVNNQGQCGACWAFSAVETIESQFLRNNPAWRTEVANGWGLSVQEVIDCSNLILAGGCQGGWADLAYMVVQAHGIENATTDPYTSGDGQSSGICLPMGPFVDGAKVSNYTFATPPCLFNCSAQNMSMLQQTVALVAPVSVCLDSSGFDDYVKGVLPASTCKDSFFSMDHCVQLVGYSINATDPSQSYWLVRNSWGPTWGLDGYIHLQFDYSINTCGLANQATNVILA